MKSGEQARHKFFAELAELLNRNKWASLTYTRDDDGIHVWDEERQNDYLIGFGSDQVDLLLIHAEVSAKNIEWHKQ